MMTRPLLPDELAPLTWWIGPSYMMTWPLLPDDLDSLTQWLGPAFLMAWPLLPDDLAPPTWWLDPTSQIRIIAAVHVLSSLNYHIFIFLFSRTDHLVSVCRGDSIRSLLLPVPGLLFEVWCRTNLRLQEDCGTEWFSGETWDLCLQVWPGICLPRPVFGLNSSLSSLYGNIWTRNAKTLTIRSTAGNFNYICPLL